MKSFFPSLFFISMCLSPSLVFAKQEIFDSHQVNSFLSLHKKFVVFLQQRGPKNKIAMESFLLDYPEIRSAARQASSLFNHLIFNTNFLSLKIEVASSKAFKGSIRAMPEEVLEYYLQYMFLQFSFKEMTFSQSDIQNAKIDIKNFIMNNYAFYSNKHFKNRLSKISQPHLLVYQYPLYEEVIKRTCILAFKRLAQELKTDEYTPITYSYLKKKLSEVEIDPKNQDNYKSIFSSIPTFSELIRSKTINFSYLLKGIEEGLGKAILTLPKENQSIIYFYLFQFFCEKYSLTEETKKNIFYRNYFEAWEHKENASPKLRYIFSFIHSNPDASIKKRDKEEYLSFIRFSSKLEEGIEQFEDIIDPSSSPSFLSDANRVAFVKDLVTILENDFFLKYTSFKKVEIYRLVHLLPKSIAYIVLEQILSNRSNADIPIHPTKTLNAQRNIFKFLRRYKISISQ